jgi:ABC-type polysaccharide/polyol phosphate export permease
MNYKIDATQLQTFWQLMVRSFVIYKPHFKNKTFNAVVWTMLNVIVVAFIMPTVGLHNFGPFILVTTAASNSFFTANNQIPGLLSEILGDVSNLRYQLSLPLAPWLTLTTYALECAYQGFISSLMIVPLGLLLLFNEFPFQYFCIIKFHFILLLISIFSGFFAVWMTSFVNDMVHEMENLWSRIIFPLWFLGGFQFSWKGLYSISPMLAYLNLLNPLTYVMEGGRAAALDPALSLPYWNCVFALIGFTIIFGYLGIMKLKKRLDCL